MENPLLQVFSSKPVTKICFSLFPNKTFIYICGHFFRFHIFFWARAGIFFFLIFSQTNFRDLAKFTKYLFQRQIASCEGNSILLLFFTPYYI